MKKAILIALASVTAIGAQAGVITIVDDAPTGYTVGTGDTTTTRSREIIRSTTQQFVMGQSFTLGALGAGDDYKLTDLYLKSASAENFDLYAGDIEVRIYSETSGAALGQFVFDLAALADGDAEGASNEVTANQWVKFTLDSGIVLADNASYSFLFAFDSTDADHKWGFRRDDTGVYGDGNQWEGRHSGTPNYSIADWDTAGGTEWTGINADGNDDFLFALDSQVVPEPATLGLFAMVGTGILFVRRLMM